MSESAQDPSVPFPQPAIPLDMDRLLEGASPEDHSRSRGVIKSGFHWDPSSEITPIGNGFLGCAMRLYVTDSATNFRIDDFWLAMLARLRPEIYKAYPAPENYDIPAVIDPAQLDTQEGVVDLMTRLIQRRFPESVAKVLMPDFSVTTVADFASAALILAGTPYKITIDEPEEEEELPESVEDPKYRDVTLVGTDDDWLELIIKLGAIEDWSPELRDLVG
ncbi:hypothetical protein FBEOM_5273 [Fusarium beomiforme]|uniref:Uncharacterized protein n=1 Tax=Fusarium beomiforme TaxID=44412 RepID=A0A9P5AL93_9HYPO|nr:hypothetical protein FBEOM_5273 [Fusarium beomiforme]